MTWPSQHGCPAPPHCWHVGLPPPPPPVRAQLRPEAVQKSLASAPPAQQAWPAPPQLGIAAPVPTQLPFVHRAGRPVAHAVAGCTQLPPTQQAPACAEQSDFWQQGLPGLPHATTLPLTHTIPLAPGLSPEATHALATQQPPPVQALLGQHA